MSGWKPTISLIHPSIHTTSLRRILSIKWQDRIPDTEVFSRDGLSSIHTTLMQAQLWAGHAAPMPDHRLAKKPLFGELEHGKCSQGGQKKRFKDTLKVASKAFGVNYSTWEQDAQVRDEWRAKIYKEKERQGKPELQAPLKLPAFHARTVQDWQAIYAPTHHNLKPLRWLDSLRQRWTNSTMCLCIILTIYTCMVICTAHCRLMHAMYAQTPVMRADHVSSSLTAAVPEASSWDNMSPSSSLKPAISSLDWIHYTLTIDITDLGLYQQLYLCQCRYVTMKT